LHEFDAAIALTQVGDGRYEGKLDRAWWIYLGPNGGFLASIWLNAMTMEVGDPAFHPRSLTVQYCARATEGPIEMQATIDRRGRNFTFAHARMFQDGKLLGTGLGAFNRAPQAANESSPDDDPGAQGSFDHDPMPEAIAPEDIPEVFLPDEAVPDFARRFDYRGALGPMPFSGADKAMSGGWIRLRQPREIDALLIPTLADAWFPAVFTRVQTPVAVPTIDLTVHFRATPPFPASDPGEWCFCRFKTLHVTEGIMEEDGEIWSRDGTLLAQSRQLALLRT
jgi:acyl-CoA thioesterase